MNRLLRVAVSAVLLIWIGCKIDWSSVGSAFARLHLGYWLGAVGLLLVAQVVSALRWQCFADQLRFPRTLPQLTGIYFIGMYFNLGLPTSVGGDVVRAWYLDAKSGRRLAAFASVLLDRLNGLMVLVGLACVAVTVVPLDLPWWIPVSVWGLAGCGLLGLTGLAIVARLDRLRPSRREQLRTMLRILHQPRTLVATTLLSVIVQVASVLNLWLVGLSIDAPVPSAYYWVLAPVISVLTLLPISVNGTGVREWAMIIFLAPLGVNENSAVPLAVLWFAVSGLCGLLGGLVYLFGFFPKPEPPAEPPGEVTRESLDSDSDQGRAGQRPHAA